jgi:hypothetical protein
MPSAEITSVIGFWMSSLHFRTLMTDPTRAALSDSATTQGWCIHHNIPPHMTHHQCHPDDQFDAEDFLRKFSIMN